MLDATIIAVGSELLTPQRTDTNSLYLTDQLNGLGIEVRQKVIVGDDRAMLTGAVREALSHAAIVVLTGGLGPTEDDVTRDAVAAALGRPMEFHQDICDAIEERFRSRARKMAEINRRQAFVIQGAEVLNNPTGTAPGLWIEYGDKLIVLLPGPPSEMKPVFETECLPRFHRRLPSVVIRARFYRVTGMTESDLDTLIAPIYTRFTNPATTVLASAGDIQVHLRARCETAEEAEQLLAEAGDPIEALLGARLYSRNGDSLEAVIGNLLRERHATLATAESLTGGHLSQRLTSIPGSSDYFLGGFLTYSDRMKTELLGVEPALLDKHSAVSQEVAAAMAEGARRRTGATCAISTTGEAGPKSNTAASPGTVFIGFSEDGQPPAVVRHVMPGDRNRVRGFATNAALDHLRRRILHLP
ncbi:MAG: competence/damage-inducible protein A [Acidobacteriota bacterium]